MSVIRLLTYFAFAAWVSVCAAVPELLWQGLLSLIDEFSRQDAYAIVLIGLILAVFVEPILERARRRRWQPEPGSRHGVLFTTATAFAFGVVAVGLHECMTAYLSSEHAAPGSFAAGVADGVELIKHWAAVPLAVTLAWFGARLAHPFPVLAGIAAAAWVVGSGWYLGWPYADIAKTFLACVVLIPLGQRYVARHWGVDTFHRLSIGMVAFIVPWIAITPLAELALRQVGFKHVPIDSLSSLAVDLRFYLGWAIGLAVAPNPVPADDYVTAYPRD